MTGKSRPLTPRQTNVSKSASVLITLEETPQGSLQFNPFRATTYGSTPFTTPPPHRADFPAVIQFGIKRYGMRCKHVLC